MEEVRLHSIEYVKKILSRWAFALWKDVGEVLGDFWVISELRPEVLDRELIVMRDFNEDNLILLQELLLTSKDLLEKVLVDVDIRWQVKLD